MLLLFCPTTSSPKSRRHWFSFRAPRGRPPKTTHDSMDQYVHVRTHNHNWSNLRWEPSQKGLQLLKALCAVCLRSRFRWWLIIMMRSSLTAQRKRSSARGINMKFLSLYGLSVNGYYLNVLSSITFCFKYYSDDLYENWLFSIWKILKKQFGMKRTLSTESWFKWIWYWIVWRRSLLTNFSLINWVENWKPLQYRLILTIDSFNYHINMILYLIEYLSNNHPFNEALWSTRSPSLNRSMKDHCFICDLCGDHRFPCHLSAHLNIDRRIKNY